MDKVTLHDVDRLGALRAQIADLRKEEKEVEERIKAVVYRRCSPVVKASPEQTVDGDLFRAVLVVQFRTTLIAAKVRELLHPNQLRVCENVTEVHSLKLTARSTEKVPA